MEQTIEIVNFAICFYDFLYDYIKNNGSEKMEITQKLARFVSLIFTFIEFEDDEIYHILSKTPKRSEKEEKEVNVSGEL